MKMDGTMKSLGVKFDMHVDNQVQLRECIETVKGKGDKILIADGRRRDKMLVVGVCLLNNIGYKKKPLVDLPFFQWIVELVLNSRQPNWILGKTKLICSEELFYPEIIFSGQNYGYFEKFNSQLAG